MRNNTFLKILLLVLAVGYIVGSLAGCKPSDEGNTNPSNSDIPALSAELKEEIQNNMQKALGDQGEILWYDEKPDVTLLEGFFRYQGTYDGYIVIHTSSPDSNISMSPDTQEEPTYSLEPTTKTYLDRSVQYPTLFDIYVYDPERNDGTTMGFLKAFQSLEYLVKTDDCWLAAEQIHRILDDFEAWTAENFPN